MSISTRERRLCAALRVLVVCEQATLVRRSSFLYPTKDWAISQTEQYCDSFCCQKKSCYAVPFLLIEENKIDKGAMTMHDQQPELSAGAESCPSWEVLANLTLGKLPTETIEALGQHVEVCTTCQTILESLDGLEDSLIADIKAHHFGAAVVDPWLEQQIREAEQISQVVWKMAESNED